MEEKTLEQLLADALKTIAKPMLEEQLRLKDRIEKVEQLLARIETRE